MSNFIKDLNKELEQRVAYETKHLAETKKGLELIGALKKNPTEIVEVRQWYDLCKFVCGQYGFRQGSDEHKTAKYYVQILGELYSFNE